MYYYKHFKNIEGFKRILSDEELNKLFSVITDDMDYLFFRLMFRKGKRISELTQLKINDIDFKNNIIVTYVSKTRSANTRRIMYIDDDIKYLLLEYCSKWSLDIAYNKGFIFYSETRKGRHKQQNCFSQKFIKYRELAGLDKLFYLDKLNKKRHHIRSHSLRATAINKVLEVSDGDIFKTLAFSHHKTIEGLIPYINEFNKRELQEMETKAFEKFKNQKTLTIYL